MTIKRSNGNAYLQLRQREYNVKTEPRNSFCTLRKLICEGNYSYRKVWEKFTNKSIASEGGKVYFENYTQCYGGYGKGSAPKHLYNLCTPNGKTINDSLLVVTQPASISGDYKIHRGSLLCIVGKSWLMRFNVESGKLLQEVYITSKFNIREIQWNEPQISIVLKSSQSVRTVPRQAGIPGVRVVTTLALFDVWPLTFTGMFEVTKTVFGKDVIDAMLSQGMLITMHYSGLVKFYSLEYIIKEYRIYHPQLYDDVSELGQICGNYPDGLPLNIIIKDCPPVLFEARCDQHSIEIGGYPWHYLYTPPGKLGSFHLKSLDTHSLAENGHFEMKNMNFEPDRAIFSTDESGRIIHVGAQDIKVYKLATDNSNRTTVKEDFCINMEKKELFRFHRRSKEDTVTSSGRKIKKRIIPDEVMEYPTFTIYNVSYEDELDVLYASGVYLTRITPPTLEGRIFFHDNNTGKLLKDIPLEQKFGDNLEHQIFVDLDTIIQIIKSPQARFVCLMYRICANLDEEDSLLEQHQDKKNHSYKSQVESQHSSRRVQRNAARQRNSTGNQRRREHRNRLSGRGNRRWTSVSSDSDGSEDWTERSMTNRSPQVRNTRRRTAFESSDNIEDVDISDNEGRERQRSNSSDEDTD